MTIECLQIYPHCHIFRLAHYTLKGASKASTVDIFKAENPK